LNERDGLHSGADIQEKTKMNSVKVNLYIQNRCSKCKNAHFWKYKGKPRCYCVSDRFVTSIFGPPLARKATDPGCGGVELYDRGIVCNGEYFEKKGERG